MLSSFAMFLVLLAIGSFPVDSLRQDENETRSEVFQIQKPSMMGVSFLDGSLQSVRINNHSNQSRNNSRESPLRSMTGQVASQPTAEERAQIKLYILQQIKEKIPDLHRELSRQEREALADEILEALFPTVSGSASASDQNDTSEEPDFKTLFGATGGFEAMKESRAKKKQEFVKAVLKEHPHVAALIAQDSLAAHEFTAWVEKAFNEDDEHWRRQAAQQTGQVASQPTKAGQRATDARAKGSRGKGEEIWYPMVVLVDRMDDKQVFDSRSYFSNKVDLVRRNLLEAPEHLYALKLDETFKPNTERAGLLQRILQKGNVRIAFAGGIGSLERAQKACAQTGGSSANPIFIPMPLRNENYNFQSLGWKDSVITDGNIGKWLPTAWNTKSYARVVPWKVDIKRGSSVLATKKMYFHMSTGYDARRVYSQGRTMGIVRMGRYLAAGVSYYNRGLSVQTNEGTFNDVSGYNTIAILNSPIMHGETVSSDISLDDNNLEILGWNHGFHRRGNGEHKYTKEARSVNMKFQTPATTSKLDVEAGKRFIQIDGVSCGMYEDPFEVEIVEDPPVRMMPGPEYQGDTQPIKEK